MCTAEGLLLDSFTTVATSNMSGKQEWLFSKKKHKFKLLLYNASIRFKKNSRFCGQFCNDVQSKNSKPEGYAL